MYVGLSKEQEALRDELRAYYDNLLTPAVEEDLRKGEGVGQVSKDTWKQMCADGWAGVGWPKEWGGSESDGVYEYLLNEALARRGGPQIGKGVGIIGKTILAHGSEKLKK